MLFDEQKASGESEAFCPWEDMGGVGYEAMESVHGGEGLGLLEAIVDIAEEVGAVSGVEHQHWRAWCELELAEVDVEHSHLVGEFEVVASALDVGD